MSKEEYEELGITRECGDCRLCCKVMSVDEGGDIDLPDGTSEPYSFHKRPGVWCEHSCSDGCAIYDKPEKPISCREFYCGWLAGFGEERDRPDKLKAVFSVEDTDEWGICLIVYEAYPGITRNSKRVQKMIAQVMENPAIDAVGIIESASLPRKLVHKRKGVSYAIPTNEQFTPEGLTVRRQDVAMGVKPPALEGLPIDPEVARRRKRENER